jgi:hypothetical protein
LEIDEQVLLMRMVRSWTQGWQQETVRHEKTPRRLVGYNRDCDPVDWFKVVTQRERSV